MLYLIFVPETLHNIFVIELFLNNYIAGIVLELLNNCYRTVGATLSFDNGIREIRTGKKADIVEYPWGQCWSRPCGDLDKEDHQKARREKRICLGEKT